MQGVFRSAYASIAAISGWIPMMFITRVWAADVEALVIESRLRSVGKLEQNLPWSRTI